MNSDGDNDTQSREEKATFELRLPSFVMSDAEGVGDIVKRVTGALRISACSNCEARAQWLNRHFPITRGRRNE